MKKLTAFVVPALLVAATAGSAHAQAIPGWKAYRAQQNPAATAAPEATALADTDAQPRVPPPTVAAPAAVPYTSYAPRKARPNGGFFIGAQGGAGWVYEDVDQRAWLANAGYRWQAGDYSQVGIEIGAGRLAETTWQGYAVPEVRFSNIGANARFNFGDSPWFAVARLGYWRAKADDDWGYKTTVDGAYAGFALGVDINRHFNLQLGYTGYAYATHYYYYDDEYDINRADTVTLGAELRF